jgi:hypothetical protein
MTQLVRFLLVNLTGGFALGLVAGSAFIQSGDNADLFDQQPLAIVMLLWGFGASFGMGAIGTGLALLQSD